MSKILQLPKRYHPDFANPRVKPIGDVEIDWRHPLTKGLEICALSGSSEKELVHGFNLLKRSGATTVVSSKGLAHDTLAAGAIIEVEGSDNLNLGTTDDISIFQYTFLSSSDPTGTFVTKRDGASYEWHYFTDTGGVGLPTILVGSTGVDSVANTSVTDKWTGIGVSVDRSASTGYHYHDGAADGSSSLAAGTQQNSSPIAIGARWNTYPTVGYDGDIITTITLVWYGRLLTAAEHRYLADNPFGILKPKQSMQYFIPSAVVGGFQPRMALLGVG